MIIRTLAPHHFEGVLVATDKNRVVSITLDKDKLATFLLISQLGNTDLAVSMAIKHNIKADQLLTVLSEGKRRVPIDKLELMEGQALAKFVKCESHGKVVEVLVGQGKREMAELYCKKVGYSCDIERACEDGSSTTLAEEVVEGRDGQTKEAETGQEELIKKEEQFNEEEEQGGIKDETGKWQKQSGGEQVETDEQNEKTNKHPEEPFWESCYCSMFCIVNNIVHQAKHGQGHGKVKENFTKIK